MLLAPLVAVLLCADNNWEKLSEEDGLVLEVQPISGSMLENLRVTGTTRASPEDFIKAWWGSAKDFSASPEIVKREIFLDDENERLYWDQIRASPASDRDYVMSLKKKGNTVEFQSVDDKRKPTSNDFVRMNLRGSVTAAPDPKGARITYVVFTDIGGLVPPAFARGAQRKASFNLVREIRRRAEKK